MSLDETLARASSSRFDQYDPAAVIHAVNALVPLGKDAALASLDRFLAHADLNADPHSGLFLVLRVAFDASPHPPMRIGAPNVPPPEPASALPRFPILLVDDVPLLLASGYFLRGLPEPLSAHVDYYRQHGTLRAHPLSPSPHDTLAHAEAAYSAAYHAPVSADERAFLEAQLARLPN